MQHRWLTLLSISVITILVFIFFWIRLQPIEYERPPESSSSIGNIDEPTVTFINPSRGAASPTVTIIEYSDFECESCKQIQSSIETALRTYGGDVRHVWKNLPNESAHPLATPAAIAAHCADQQGAFWDYHDELFEAQSFLSESLFTQIATELELDVKAFTKCYETRDTLPIVRKDYEEGIALGLIATPTLFINGESVVGAITTEELLSYVQQALE